MTTTTAQPISYSVRTAADATGLSRQHLRDAIHRGELKARRSSRNDDGDGQGSFVIRHVDLVAYVNDLPEG